MNRKQKVLTIIALVAFVVIGAGHYLAWPIILQGNTPYLNIAAREDAILGDVRMPWFMLGVIYVGLFFLLADRKEKR